MTEYRIDSKGVIKVSDFGLTRNSYEKLYVRQDKSQGVKLPIKWLAIESLNDGVFSEKTDVVGNSFIHCIYTSCILHIYTVVLWGDMLGGVQWWEGALCWNLLDGSSTVD